MHSTVLDYIDLAVLFIVSAICVCMFALLMVEWSVPISYNRDKSTINLNADIGNDVLQSLTMTGADIKAMLTVATANSIEHNRIGIEVYCGGTPVKTDYAVITVDTDWIKAKGENLKILCAVGVGAWELDGKLSSRVTSVYYDIDRDAWIYRLEG